MFGFKKDHKVIQVQFVENGSAKPFAQSAVPIDQLPDNFQIATTLHINEADWQVDHAEPANKGEFRKTGTLLIYLYKARPVTVPASQLLYSLATISDELPKLVPASLEGVFVVHEDDWRQVELVANSFSALVQEEFAAIREIYLHHRRENGFESLHVRRLIPSPLAGTTLPLPELHQLLGVTHEYQGIAFSSTAAVVEYGFAFPIGDELILWGKTTEQGLVSTLCINGAPGLQYSPPMVDLLRRHDLLFVDWLNPPA